MADLGVRLFTDDGDGVQDARLMRRAFEYASALGVTLAQHCEDPALSAGTHMHEGEWSGRLGIPGQPAAAEELMAAREYVSRTGPFNGAPAKRIGHILDDLDEYYIRREIWLNRETIVRLRFHRRPASPSARARLPVPLL